MNLRPTLLILLSPVALAACGDARPGSRPEVSPAARVVGEPESCVSLVQVRETRVRDDWTIDFIGNGNRVWRNTLPNRCPGLKLNDGISYQTSLSQLCSTDIVHVLETSGGLHRGAGCGLGPFVPVELEPR